MCTSHVRSTSQSGVRDGLFPSSRRDHSGSLQSAQRASHSEGPEQATSDSGNVPADGAESCAAAGLDWHPNYSALGDADMEPLTDTALPQNRFSISNRGMSGILNAYQYISRISGALEDSNRVIDPKMRGYRGTAYGRMKLQTGMTVFA